METNRKMTNDIQKQIDAHLLKATTLHPVFCDEVLSCPSYPETYALAEARAKRACNSVGTAENIVREEIAEVFAAIAAGEYLQARSEIYDAIAVLIRLDGEVVKEIGEAR